MNEDKTQELLLRLIEDMAVVKAKLDTLEEIKIGAKESNIKIEKLEMQNERHEKQLKTLENRANTLEQFVREGLKDTKKTQTSVFISIGVALFSAILSFVLSFI
jgi:DNA repair exonuclease SbcCD ATPase subunit